MEKHHGAIEIKGLEWRLLLLLLLHSEFYTNRVFIYSLYLASPTSVCILLS
jgi:hypothetical protein